MTFCFAVTCPYGACMNLRQELGVIVMLILIKQLDVTRYTSDILDYFGISCLLF